MLMVLVLEVCVKNYTIITVTIQSRLLACKETKVKIQYYVGVLIQLPQEEIEVINTIHYSPVES